MRFQLEQDRNLLNPEEEPSTIAWVFPWYQRLPGSSPSTSNTPPPGVSDGLHLLYLYAVLSYPYLRLRCLFTFHHRSVVHCTLLYIKENILITIIQTCWFVIVPREPYHNMLEKNSTSLTPRNSSRKLFESTPQS